MSENPSVSPSSASPFENPPASDSVKTDAPTAVTSTETAASDPGSPGESPEVQALRKKLGLDKGKQNKGEGSGADPKADTKSDGTSEPASTTPEKKDGTTASTSSDTTPEDVDTSAATGAALLAKKDRALKAKSEKIASEAKAVADQKAELAPVLAAREKFKTATDAKGRASALLEMIGGNVTVEEVALLSELAGQDKPALTEEDARRMAKEMIEAEKKAEKERVEAEEKERNERVTKGEKAQLDVAASYLAEASKKDPERYKMVMYKGLSHERYVELMKAGHKATGKIPPAELIFDFVEQEYREDAKKNLGWLFPAPAPEAEKPKSKTVTSDDKRGVTTIPDKDEDEDKPKETVAERIARRRREAVAKAVKALEKRP